MYIEKIVEGSGDVASIMNKYLCATKAQELRALKVLCAWERTRTSTDCSTSS